MSSSNIATQWFEEQIATNHLILQTEGFLKLDVPEEYW